MQIDEILEKCRSRFLIREEKANKGSYGRLLILAGSQGMAGAAYLSGKAAFRSGIGMVKYLGPECNRTILQSLLPEAMYESFRDRSGLLPEEYAEWIKAVRKKLRSSLDWADEVIIGPGFSQDEQAGEQIRLLFEEGIRSRLAMKKLVVIDADALNLIAAQGLDLGLLREGRICITPHMVEMKRLSGIEMPVLKADPEAAAASFAREKGITVVLKDYRTAVSTEEDSILIEAGTPAMAKAGSGDVLTGVIAGITAVLSYDTALSVPAAVFLHGLAGRLAAEQTGVHSLLAGEIADSIGAAMGLFDK